MLQGIEFSAIQSREHDSGTSNLSVSKGMVSGVKMGLQIAARELFGNNSNKAFSHRANPNMPGFLYGFQDKLVLPAWMYEDEA